MADFLGIGNNYSRSFLDDVALDRIPGMVRRNFFGVNTDVDTGPVVSSWPFSGNKWVRPSVATDWYISSSSASDTQNSFVLTMIDANWEESQVIVTPTGQTPLKIPGGPWLRINDAVNISNLIVNAPIASAGDIWFANEDNHTAGVPNDSTKVQGLIKIESGVSPEKLRNGFNTIPIGKIGLIENVFAWSGRNKDITARWTAAINTTTSLGVPLEFVPIQIYQSDSHSNLISAPFPELSDIEFTVETANNNSSFQIVVQMVLVDQVAVQT